MFNQVGLCRGTTWYDLSVDSKVLFHSFTYSIAICDDIICRLSLFPDALRRGGVPIIVWSSILKPVVDKAWRWSLSRGVISTTIRLSLNRSWTPKGGATGNCWANGFKTIDRSVVIDVVSKNRVGLMERKYSVMRVWFPWIDCRAPGEKVERRGFWCMVLFFWGCYQ